MQSKLAARLEAADSGLRHLAAIVAFGGGIALAALMGVTLVAVNWRYVLNDPIFGIEDISTMALTVVVASSVAFGAQRGAHVSVNVISYFGGRSLTRITDVAARLLSFAIVSTAAYALFLKGGCGLACGATTNNLSIVHTPFYYVLALCLTVYAAVILLQLFLGIAHWNGHDPYEPDA